MHVIPGKDVLYLISQRKLLGSNALYEEAFQPHCDRTQLVLASARAQHKQRRALSRNAVTLSRSLSFTRTRERRSEGVEDLVESL
eukprot:48962-Rhodomonas_salina.1